MLLAEVLTFATRASKAQGGDCKFRHDFTKNLKLTIIDKLKAQKSFEKYATEFTNVLNQHCFCTTFKKVL